MLVGRPDLAHNDLCFEKNSLEYYQLKLDNVLESLSKTFHQDKQWYEFWDLDITPVRTAGFGHVIDLARLKQKTLTHNIHWNNDLEVCKKKFPDLKVIKLENFFNFNSHCFSLKSQDTDLERHQQGFDFWLANSPAGDIAINIDDMMSDSKIFLIEIQKLYDFFEFEDYDAERLLIFYQKYLELHTLPK